MTIPVLQDKYGKPVAFREKVAAAKTIVVQVTASALASKGSHGLPLALVGTAEKAAFSIEAMLKLKEPDVSIVFASDGQDGIIAKQAVDNSTGEQADLLVYLSDVPGVVVGEGKRALQVYTPGSTVSSSSAGADEAVVAVAWASAQAGLPVILAGAWEADVLLRIVAGQDVGTLFEKDAAAATAGAAGNGSGGAAASAQACGARDMAVRARRASRVLQALPTAARVAALHRVAEALSAGSLEVLAENAKDVEEWKGKISEAMLQRLILTPSKLSQLSEGVRAIAAQEEPMGRLIKRMEVAEGLTLDQLTSSIGVLLVIFESRPDALPQIVSLALRSGNGLMLKGGREAARSNSALYALVTSAIGDLGQGSSGKDLVALVTSREEIVELLQLDDVIDLVIPRGSNQLVSYIQRNTRIPVLGHADGVCHMYIDKDANPEVAVKLVVDAKIDYPAACNALEKVLVHSSFLGGGTAGLDLLIAPLVAAGVTVHAGDRLLQLMPQFPPAPFPRHEYGSMDVTVELVDSMAEAIDHIHRFGSSHTECIVTDDAAAAEVFLRTVDSACVFHNASTRFADGFRFGLGAEVGISTGRIHARGPVGVEGLLTTKWQMRGAGHIVAKDKGVNYTFKKIALPATTE